MLMCFIPIAELNLTDVVTNATGSGDMNGECFQNPDLYRLAKQLPYYLLESRSDNTVKKYFAYFKKWKSFIGSRGETALPANPVHVALFVTHLLETGSSAAVISSHVYGIKWAHNLAGHADPTTHPFITSLMETAKRTHQPLKSRRDPVSGSEVRALCEKYKDSKDILVLRDLCMILLCFSGFLRFDEVSNLRCCDVTIEIGHLCLFISHSKTDQYRQGDSIVIAKLCSVACPYAMLKRYASVATIDFLSSDFLFKPVFHCTAGWGLIRQNKKLSYSRARENIVRRLQEICGPERRLGLHSLRAGGATAAANANVGDRCWKRHGRWKSDTAKDGYVVDSLEHRLQVTQNLGL